MTRVGQLVAQEASRRLNVPFGIVDLSLAPTPAVGDSVAEILEEIGVEEVSIGDFVLTGGELPALMIIDAVSRMIPGVLGNTDSADTDSFMNGLLEYPQYSRPAVWHGKEVPPVLLSGDHARVDEWRFEQSLAITKERRPDLYEKFVRDNPEIMEERRKRIERAKRLEERRR